MNALAFKVERRRIDRPNHKRADNANTVNHPPHNPRLQCMQVQHDVGEFGHRRIIMRSRHQKVVLLADSDKVLFHSPYCCVESLKGLGPLFRVAWILARF